MIMLLCNHVCKFGLSICTIVFQIVNSFLYLLKCIKTTWLLEGLLSNWNSSWQESNSSSGFHSSFHKSFCALHQKIYPLLRRPISVKKENILSVLFNRGYRPINYGVFHCQSKWLFKTYLLKSSIPQQLLLSFFFSVSFCSGLLQQEPLVLLCSRIILLALRSLLVVQL